MTVGWAMIGIGVLSDRAIAPSIARQRDSELVAVCSRDQGRADAFASEHGGEGLTDYSAMLARDDVDVVYIATPNGLHHEHVLAALDAGKHVLVEKPMTITLSDARDLVKAAEAARRHLGVGFHMRHKSANQDARRWIADGRIGELAYFDIAVGAGKDLFPYDTWRSDPALAGGGTLMNQGTHAIDLLTFVTGQPIVEVSCQHDATGDDAEQVLAATCRLRDGALATLAANQVLSGTRRDWVAVGSEAWIHGQRGLGGKADERIALHRRGEDTEEVHSAMSAHDGMIDAFTRAVLGEQPVNGDGEDGLYNVGVVQALYRAARERRTVSVEEVMAGS